MKFNGLLLIAMGAMSAMAAMDTMPKAVNDLLQERLERNPAWKRAQQTPPFDNKAPSGFVQNEAEKARQRAAGEALKAQVAAAIAAGKTEFRMATGEYRFADNSGWQFTNVKNFTLDGNGSTLWFERPMSQLAANPQSLLFTRCQNMTLKNVAIDFDLPVYIQGRILSIAADRKSLEMEIDADWPKAGMGGGQFTLYTPAGEYIPQYTLMHQGATLHDGNCLSVKLDASQLEPYLVRSPKSEYRGMYGKVSAGTLIALNFRRGWTIHINECERMTFENIDVWQSQGMGILENDGIGNNKYLNCRLIRKPGTRRIHYGTADHFHSNRVTNGALIQGCEFAHTSDDNLNLHGNWRYFWKQLAPDTLLIGAPRPPQKGMLFSLHRIGQLQKVGEATVTEVTVINDDFTIDSIAVIKPSANERIAWRGAGKLYAVKLDKALTLPQEQLLVDTHVDNAKGFVVRDCYFHDSRSRAALLTGVGGGLLENNIWSNVHSGLNVYEESWGYAEGAIPSHVRIIGNTLIRCGGIETGLVPRDTPQGICDNKVITNLDISNNLIVDGSYIHIMYADGAKVSNNTFIDPCGYFRQTGDFSESKNMYGHPQYLKMERHGVVFVTSSRHVAVSGNTAYLVGPGDMKPVELGLFTEEDTISTDNNSVIHIKNNTRK